MHRQVCALLLVLSMFPLGCSTGPSGSSVPPSQVPNVTGNWVIESASLYTPPSSPVSGLLLTGGLTVGASQGDSSSVTGTLTFGYIGTLTACQQPQVVSFTGTVDAARNLTLTSEALPGGGVITVNMPLPVTLSTYGTGGTIAISAGACAQASQAVTGALQEPLNGTYTGSISPGRFDMTNGAAVGSGSLVLTEAPVILDGATEYGLSGTFTYTFGTCTGSVAVSGIHTGVALALNGPLTLPSTVQIVGGANSTADSLQIDEVQFSPFPCPTDPSNALLFSGTLTRQ